MGNLPIYKLILLASAFICFEGCTAQSHDSGAQPASVPTSAATSDSASEAGLPQMIHPDAQRLLKLCCDALMAAKSFSFNAEIWEDQVVATHKVSTTKIVDVQVGRPDRLHAEIQSPRRNRGIWYDGKTVTSFDRANNLYGSVPAPSTIDAMVDALDEKYGIVIPLDDLILSDPYTRAMPHIRSGAYFGKATILGTPCEHIAFSTDNVDWQMWVEQTGDHLPRKIVITYKHEEAQPQYTAIFSKWQLNPNLPAEAFTFTPPARASKVEVKPRSDNSH